MSEEDFFGITVLNIAADGCLNGLWTNNDVGGELFNEVWKKTNKSPVLVNINGEELYKEYLLSYNESNLKSMNGSVSLEIDNNNVISVIWKVKKCDCDFHGRGFLIDKQLIIYYWKK